MLTQPLLTWAKMDSNHRRYKPADLQSAPFGHSGIRPNADAKLAKYFEPAKYFLITLKNRDQMERRRNVERSS